MKTPKIDHWNIDDFKTYILLYCANADCAETQEEKEMILKQVKKNDITTLHSEFDKDTDYERIQKIIAGAKQFDYDKNSVIQDITNVFEADGRYDTMEKNLLMGLKHLIT